MELKIGDIVIPTYIDDEWLSQYINFPLRIVTIEKVYEYKYSIETTKITVETLTKPVNQFNLFKNIDFWKVKE